MELTQENVEKLNVAKMPDALLCKGLLLDAIEAVDKLEAENERLNARNKYLENFRNEEKEIFTPSKIKIIKDLKKENARLKCLALHLMSEYCFAQGTIIHTKLELTEQTIEEDRKMIHKVNIRDRWGEYFAEAYRKSKAELGEGK